MPEQWCTHNEGLGTLQQRSRSPPQQAAVLCWQVEALEPEAKRARLGDAEGAGGEGLPGGEAGADAGGEAGGALRGLMAHELQLRDRNSMLAVPNRNLSKVGAGARASELGGVATPLQAQTSWLANSPLRVGRGKRPHLPLQRASRSNS